MSVRMRHTSGHTRNRRSHHALDAVKSVAGEQEGTLRLPHHIDEATGLYRGRQIAPAAASATAGKPAKVKGIDTEPSPAHVHEHAHAEHANAEAKSTKGVFGKVFSGDSRPRSRSGMGGGV